jgi:hypothetical protein
MLGWQSWARTVTLLCDLGLHVLKLWARVGGLCHDSAVKDLAGSTNMAVCGCICHSFQFVRPLRAEPLSYQDFSGSILQFSGSVWA